MSFLLLTDASPRVVALPDLKARGRLIYASENPFPWIGVDGFLLGDRIAKNEDVDAVLAWYVARRFRIVRVFAAMSIVPEQRGRAPFMLTPDEVARVVAVLSRRGIYACITVGDMQILMPDHDQQRAYLTSIASQVGETCNEPFKNGVDVVRMGRTGHRFQASGNYRLRDVVTNEKDKNGRIIVRQYLDGVLDAVFNHSERKAEFVRTPHFLEELWDGWNVVAESGPHKGKRVIFEGVEAPGVEDEGTGFAEVRKGDSRSDSPEQAFDYAACAALFGPGATYHSDAGIDAVVPGPVQDACAQAFVAGLEAISVQAPEWEYTRGGTSACPIEHVDRSVDRARGALRTYVKYTGTFAVVVALDPGPEWRCTPVNGWRVISATGLRPDRHNIVYLER